MGAMRLQLGNNFRLYLVLTCAASTGKAEWLGESYSVCPNHCVCEFSFSLQTGSLTFLLLEDISPLPKRYSPKFCLLSLAQSPYSQDDIQYFPSRLYVVTYRLKDRLPARIHPYPVTNNCKTCWW